MTRAGDLLHRFRPAGAPGAPSATGVPADHLADPAAELQPLFTELTVTERECAAVIARAQQDADRVRVRAADQAQALIASARGQVDGERAAALARARQCSDEESATALQSAERDATQIRRGADERLPPYVESVIASVAELIGEPVGDRPPLGQTPDSAPIDTVAGPP